MGKKKEEERKLVELLKEWQKMEGKKIDVVTEALNSYDNAFVQAVMKIFRRDAHNHRIALQLIVNNFEKKPIKLESNELVDYWDLLEEHDAIERETVELAKEAMSQTDSPLVYFLINYLYLDENKHGDLLEDMSRVKDGMYPYT